MSGTSCPATPTTLTSHPDNLCYGFAQDVADRINAERAARGLSPLTVGNIQGGSINQDAQYAAESVEHNAGGAYYGTQDPISSNTCTASTVFNYQTCLQQVIYITASNGNPASSPYPGSGTAGALYPGDGSDGIMQQIMNAPNMRDAILAAGDNVLGVGVGCADVPGGPGQAPLLPVDEVYVAVVLGYVNAPGNTYANWVAQNQAQLNAAGGTLPATPNPVGLGTGVPWYCPQQAIDASGDLSQTGGAYRYASSTPITVDPTMPSGTVGQDYGVTGQGMPFQASGGIAPYTWTVVSGAVPGLYVRNEVLMGTPTTVLMGTPTTPGTYTLTVRVADNYGDTGSGQVTVNVPPPPQVTSLVGTSPVVGMAATPDGKGYWLTDAAGFVSDHGDAQNYGDMGGKPLNQPIAHIVSTPDGKGYWLVAADGGIFSFGDAGFFGSMGGKSLNAPVVSMAPTQDGKGYWLVASDGGIFAFGDAKYQGSMGGHPLNKPVVGIAADYATGGYWEVATDGGIFTFNAPFRGSTGSLVLNQPVNGMTVAPNDNGYRLVAADGGIFSFGAPFYGSLGGTHLNAPIVGMASDPATGGYWMVGSDGGIFSFHAPFYGAG